MAGFSVVVDGAARVVAVSGEVDISHAEDLACVGLLTLESLNGNRESLIIDLAAVPFMDSTGLGALVTIRNAAQAEGRRVVFCRGCATTLPAGHMAVYFRLDKQVECIPCFEQSAHSDVTVQADGDPMLATVPTPVAIAYVDELHADHSPSQTADAELGVEVPLEAGTAGGSARRERERRVAKREARIRAAHPRLGGLILAISDEPQSTTAWERGAVGEEKLARSLDGLVERGVRVLHDRRIPGSRANIDHMVVAPAGVFVVDARRYKGRPHLRVEGGIVRARVEKLMVGGRDCSKLITGIQKQVDLVAAALTAAPLTDLPPVRGMLCFVDADWPLFGGAFTTANIEVLWPKKIAEHALAAKALTADQVRTIHAALGAHFPPA